MLRSPVGLALAAVVVLGAGAAFVGFLCVLHGIDKGCKCIGRTTGR